MTKIPKGKKRFQVELTIEEYEELNKVARSNGTNVTAMIRKMILDHYKDFVPESTTPVLKPININNFTIDGYSEGLEKK